MQHEMTDDDMFIAIWTAFEVVSPEGMLPRARWNQHERNSLVDPDQCRAEFFG
jgi:NAD-dependent deacetylase